MVPYTTTPTYYTNQAVYLDEKEADGNAYVYVAFTLSGTDSDANPMDTDIHLLRIRSSGTLAIDWHMRYKYDGTTVVNEAHHIFRDFSDPNSLYFSGMYSSRGMMAKFQRRDGKITWQVDFMTTGSVATLDSVTSYAQATGLSHFVACGDKNNAGTGKMPAFFRMENTG